jgi:hypothetical protein
MLPGKQIGRPSHTQTQTHHLRGRVGLWRHGLHPKNRFKIIALLRVVFPPARLEVRLIAWSR